MLKYALFAGVASATSVNLCLCQAPTPPTAPYPPVAPVPVAPFPPFPVCSTLCNPVVLSGACLNYTIGCTSAGQYIATGTSSSVTLSLYGGSNCSISTSNQTVTKTCNSNGLEIKCFSGSDKATLQDGTTKFVKDVQVGDMVMTVRTDRTIGYDRVFRVTRHDETSVTNFIRLTTASGHSIEMTPGHFVQVGDIAMDSLKTADEVKVGDFVFVVDGERARPSAVVKIESVTSTGYYNFHTTSGVLVVNGVVGSHFTTESTWTNKAAATYWYSLLNVLPQPIRSLIDGPADVRRA
jgi:hypothetical protein